MHSICHMKSKCNSSEVREAVCLTNERGPLFRSMSSNKEFVLYDLQKNYFANLAIDKYADFLFHSCNPPAVPYLGMYLTDLAFIEEGTPNFTGEGLVNFSKMRMVIFSSLYTVPTGV